MKKIPFKKINFLVVAGFASLALNAQYNYTSQVWSPDNKNGTYKNPVVNADYSDPDAVRVGDDFYMVSSSFNHVPGLPILHSKDLVNWKLITHVLKQQPPAEHFAKVQHGNGVWAPSIRYNRGEFYIYYPDPDFGIYMTKAKNIMGPWTEAVLVEAGSGLIDPCPLWDDDGTVYLVHAFAGSRAGFKTIVVIKKLNAEGTKTIDEGVLVFDGHKSDATVEGPKLYKKNGYYYIFAPAGGVPTGWQLVLRSKNIYGPYERKVVMDQGKTPINGPHQGAWVTTQTGEDWFLHFQDKDAYGRVVHLQPMKWVNNWPVIGMDTDGDGKGEPVLVHRKPNVNGTYPYVNPAESDEFSEAKMGLQWQWQANPKGGWAFTNPTTGTLRLNAQLTDSTKNYFDLPSLLMQKFPADEFVAVTKILFTPKLVGDKVGLMIFGTDYAYISVTHKADGNYFTQSTCLAADKGKAEKQTIISKQTTNDFYMKVTVTKGGICQFAISENGTNFTNAGEPFTAKPDKWVGAKVGLFVTSITKTNDGGIADVDWFRVLPY